MNPKPSAYDDYAAEYSAYVAQRERGGVTGDPMGILPDLLAVLGDVAGCRVLDAGCGEGYLARILAEHGARVTGMDLAPRLIELAQTRDPGKAIDYRVADLSAPLPDEAGQFDARRRRSAFTCRWPSRGHTTACGRRATAFHGPGVRQAVAHVVDAAAARSPCHEGCLGLHIGIVFAEVFQGSGSGFADSNVGGARYTIPE
jgi:SAM-dependent methyltransferase